MAGRRSRGDGSVYKNHERNCWMGVADLGLQNGKRVRRKVSAPTKTEARQRLAELLAQAGNGGTVPRADLTVRHVVDELLSNPPGSWASPVSMQVNRSHAQRINDALGSVRVNKLTAAPVEKFLAAMVADGYSTSTIAKTRGVLRLALRRAQRDHGLARNVAELASIPNGSRRDCSAMTMEQIDKLLALELSPWWRAYLETAIKLGLRPGELHGLRWEDVDFEAGEMRVRRSLKRVNGELVLADLKTAKSRRTQDMPAAVAEALRAHRKDQLAKRMRAAERWQDYGLVFSSRNGRPRKPFATSVRFKQLCELAGIGGDWQLRELRHSFVSALSDAGVHIEAISDAMGHATSRVTQQVYRHQIRDKSTAAALVWDSLASQQAQAGEVQA
jgi:integrase